MTASIAERITQLEQGLSERPLTYAVQDIILNRLAALEDRLLAVDDQPTADQLSTVVLRAEYDAWKRVNSGADVVEWTIHFARTRGLGLGVAAQCLQIPPLGADPVATDEALVEELADLWPGCMPSIVRRTLYQRGRADERTAILRALGVQP